MVMRGVIYMSAGSSLFLWEPVCLPKIYISSHPLNWSTAYEREGACTHHLHVCGLVLSGFVFLRQCSPINVRPYQPCQCGIHFISLLSSLIKYPPPTSLFFLAGNWTLLIIDLFLISFSVSLMQNNSCPHLLTQFFLCCLYFTALNYYSLILVICQG